jgi:hypothetical protein
MRHDSYLPSSPATLQALDRMEYAVVNATASPDVSSSYWAVYKFFASQSQHKYEIIKFFFRRSKCSFLTIACFFRLHGVVFSLAIREVLSPFLPREGEYSANRAFLGVDPA